MGRGKALAVLVLEKESRKRTTLRQYPERIPILLRASSPGGAQNIKQIKRDLDL